MLIAPTRLRVIPLLLRLHTRDRARLRHFALTKLDPDAKGAPAARLRLAVAA
jgi:hypothetical protein